MLQVHARCLMGTKQSVGGPSEKRTRRNDPPSPHTHILAHKPHTQTPALTRPGVDPSRVYIKVASTWQGVEACRRLQREGIDCNMTLLFSFGQVGVNGCGSRVSFAAFAAKRWSAFLIGASQL